MQTATQPKISILIVGAGAMGLVAGYHLSLAGAAVTFLVRPARVAAMEKPQILYCYDDNSLKNFANYQVISDPVEAAAKTYDYVIVTFDGSTATAEGGTLLLKTLGNTIRSSNAKVIIGGVGIGLRAHYITTMNLPPARVLNGLLGLLSHQVQGVNLPLHPPTDAALLAQASMAYRHFSKKNGFGVDSTYPEEARKFAEIYNKCVVSRCAIINKTLFAILSKTPFTLFIASELLGWPKIMDITKNKDIYRLHGRAVRELARLPEHGWVGKIAALFLTDYLAVKMWGSVEKSTLPLDFTAFNRFHHGGKVKAQDKKVMQDCVKLGEASGQPMLALKDLLARQAAYEAAAVSG